LKAYRSSRKASNCSSEKEEIKSLGTKNTVIIFLEIFTPKLNFERYRNCEANGRWPLFKCGVAKHLKEATHGCQVGVNKSYLYCYL